MKLSAWFSLIILSVSFIRCSGPDQQTPAPSSTENPVKTLSYSIIKSYAHDTSFFTEGLEFYHNSLLESTGLNGRSRLVQVNLETGKVEKQVNLDKKYFGEGITVLHDTLYQLTWQEHVVHVYSAKDFKKINELKLEGQGWGLTNDGTSLIASDGKSMLYFYEPSTFKLKHTVDVTENGSPVPNINELEYINGYVYANQWMMNYIVKIDPQSGKVVAKMDLTDLVKRTVSNDSDVLNGIAYNPATNKVYITGKNWPVLYEIQFDH